MDKRSVSRIRIVTELGAALLVCGAVLTVQCLAVLLLHARKKAP
jgi:hypothetical protein